MGKDRSDDSLFSEDAFSDDGAPSAPEETHDEDTAGTPAPEADAFAASEEDTVKVRYSGDTGGEVATVSVGGYDIDFKNGDQEVPRSVADAAVETFPDTVEVAE